MVTSIDGAGTPECVWQAWPGLHEFPLLDLSGCTRLVVLAPHPDDEVLGVGGLLATAAAAGIAAQVVAVTDGGASHPGSPTLSPRGLAERRRTEQEAALRELVPGSSILRLGIADGAVAAAEAPLADAVADLLGASTWCVSTWGGDGHPDHEAVGRAGGAACLRTGGRLVEYPIWTWHWSHPGDDRVPWRRARSLSLVPAVHAAKRAAISRHRSQIAPLSEDPRDAAILTADMLARLSRDTEVVFV